MGRKVLIVDDDVTLAELLGQSLEREGYEVVTAADGEQGVDAVMEQKPDLIISDILMSAMDGWEFCKILRTNTATKAIPFIFLTSVNKAPEKMRALRMGADEYITKPFKLDHLLEKLKALAARLEGRDEVLRGKEARGIGDMAANILIDTVEYLRASSRTGSVTVEGGVSSGLIYLENGAVVHTSYGLKGGEKALLLMLKLTESQVVFKEGRREDLERNFQPTWEKFMSALMESESNQSH